MGILGDPRVVLLVQQHQKLVIIADGIARVCSPRKPLDLLPYPLNLLHISNDPIGDEEDLRVTTLCVFHVVFDPFDLIDLTGCPQRHT